MVYEDPLSQLSKSKEIIVRARISKKLVGGPPLVCALYCGDEVPGFLTGNPSAFNQHIASTDGSDSGNLVGVSTAPPACDDLFKMLKEPGVCT